MAARSQGYAAYNRHSLEHVSATVDPTAGEPIVVLSFARSPVLDRGYRKQEESFLGVFTGQPHGGTLC